MAAVPYLTSKKRARGRCVTDQGLDQGQRPLPVGALSPLGPLCPRSAGSLGPTRPERGAAPERVTAPALSCAALPGHEWPAQLASLLAEGVGAAVPAHPLQG